VLLTGRKSITGTAERKSLVVSAEFKADIEKREVTGYASTFGNIDRGDDRVVKGAYTKTIDEDLPVGRIKVRRNHDGVIGRPIHMEQDSKGLLTVSRISATPLGDETLTLVADGVVDRMSIGYRLDGPDGKRYVNENGRKIRELVSLRLDEYSLLDLPPMNESAAITDVKTLYDVGCALDQMSSALWHLRALGDTPPEVLKRLIAMAAEIEELTAATEQAEDAATLNSVAAALSELNTLLTSPRSAA
jgi:HK97 family phage prohead protease